jgi:hypothetical protein
LRLPRFVAPNSRILSPTGTPIRAHQLNPNDRVRLSNRREVTVQEYLDDLEELERQSPGILDQMRRAPPRRRLSPQAGLVLMRNQRVLTESVKGRGHARTGFSRAMRVPPRRLAPRPANPGPPTKAFKNWQQGDSTLAANLGLRLENSLGSSGVMCSAAVVLDVTIFGHNVPSVAELVARAHQNGSTLAVGAEIKALGKTYFSTAATGFISETRSVSSPRFKTDVPIFGPVFLGVDAQIKGTVTIEGSLGVLDNGQPGCAFERSPGGSLTAEANAQLQVGSGFIAKLVSKLAKIGVAGEVAIAEVAVPMRSEIWQSGRGAFRERISAAVDASFMSGSIDAYIDIPDILGILGGGGYFTVNIFSWPGVTLHEDVFRTIERPVMMGATAREPFDGLGLSKALSPSFALPGHTELFSVPLAATDG